MARIYREYYSVPLPDGAELRGETDRKGKPTGRTIVRFYRGDKRVEGVLNDTGDRVRIETDEWYVRCKRANGQWVKRRGFTDKSATEALARRLEREAAADAGDPFSGDRKKPIGDHLAGFETYLTGRKRSTMHVAQTVQRIRDAITGMKTESVADITADRLLAWITEARQGRQVAVLAVTGTVKGYPAIARAFGVHVDTVRYWRVAGAPIVMRKPNNLTSIAKWLAEWKSRSWSEATEAQCKSTTQRIKGRGRRWDLPHAEALMALAALESSNLWDKWWSTPTPAAA